jgi:hypothetical protein
MVVVVLGVWYAAAGDGNSEVQGTTLGPNGVGIIAKFPKGWHGEVGPGAYDQVLIAMRTSTRSKSETPISECESGYLQRLTLRITEGEGVTPTPPPIKRPKHFSLRVGKVDSGEGSDTCYIRSQYVAFNDHGRTLSVQLDIGKDVSKAHLQEAYSILDGLVIRPTNQS